MTTTMDYKTKDYPELNAWIKNMRFTNSFLLKEDYKNRLLRAYFIIFQLPY